MPGTPAAPGCGEGTAGSPCYPGGMRILVLGDVVGEPGRRLVEEHLPELRRELAVDFVIVNGENAAHGHGISARIAESWLSEFGVDVIATLFQKENRLLRPAN